MALPLGVRACQGAVLRSGTMNLIPLRSSVCRKYYSERSENLSSAACVYLVCMCHENILLKSNILRDTYIGEGKGHKKKNA